MSEIVLQFNAKQTAALVIALRGVCNGMLVDVSGARVVGSRTVRKYADSLAEIVFALEQQPGVMNAVRDYKRGKI